MLCAVRGRDRPLPRTVTQVQMIVIPAAMRQRSFYLHNSPQYPHVCARCACGAGRAGPGTADPPGAADASDPAGPPGAVDPSGAAAKPYIFPPLSDKSPVELLAAKQKCMILGLADGGARVHRAHRRGSQSWARGPVAWRENNGHTGETSRPPTSQMSSKLARTSAISTPFSPARCIFPF
jgi:hypothetical protein